MQTKREEIGSIGNATSTELQGLLYKANHESHPFSFQHSIRV